MTTLTAVRSEDPPVYNEKAVLRREERDRALAQVRGLADLLNVSFIDESAVSPETYAAVTGLLLERIEAAQKSGVDA